ncbi:hypothetical protein HK103_003950 [Boothiomyces macroporosus]|uniref:Translation initiation factor eIF2B subunit epsilon n=1 Tax=Boothiomyces macroporosus TaxID=261099 RepID=A0AAD5Y8K7_9FUNG|nr:hypothetical protein HK103_003950 [Boothiomyces macroporosus]
MPLVEIIVSQELRSMGDVLRDMDAKQILQSDFILMSGDVVSNVNLAPLVEEHKKRKLADKNLIMTLVTKQASANHPTRSKAEEELFVLDTKTNECVHYEAYRRYPPRKNVSLNPRIFKTHPDIVIHNDLIDCQIDICSIEVPALFTENFDYQDIRKDFLKGILESELLGKSIYCHILQNEYAAQVSTLQMYNSISKDIMLRWVYPLAPENIFYRNDGVISHSLHNIYKGEKLTLDRSATLTEMVVIGSGTKVGANTKISHSVIGENCTIGANAVIEGSYIFANSVIGDKCVISKSIVGENVQILEKVTLENGCVLDFGVCVGPNVKLEPRTRISAEKHSDEYHDDSENELEYDVVGRGGRGYVYNPDYSDDEDEIDLRNVSRSYLDYESPSEYTEADQETDPETDGEYEEEEGNEWYVEVEQTIQRAFDENHSAEIAVLELNTLKMAMNITFQDLRQIVFPAILKLVMKGGNNKDRQKVVAKWFPVLVKFTHSDDDQMHLLNLLQQFLVDNPALISFSPQLIMAGYNIDLFKEEMILKWYENGPPINIKDAVLPLIKWLNEAETESEDESD